MMTERFDWAQNFQRHFHRLLRALSLIHSICLRFEFLNVPWDDLGCHTSLVLGYIHMSLEAFSRRKGGVSIAPMTAWVISH